VKTLKLKIRKSGGGLKSNNKLYLVEDFIGINIEDLLLKLAPRIEGIIPFACSNIGANRAESFPEREIHTVDQIMRLSKTKLSDEMLEKLVL